MATKKTATATPAPTKAEVKKTTAKAVKPAKPEVVDAAPATNVTFDAKAARVTLGITQTPFWERVFVTQSGGSRYENDRSVPKPVQALLVLAYGSDKEAQAMFNHLRGVEA